jgi:PAS domain S-box-containing protein
MASLTGDSKLERMFREAQEAAHIGVWEYEEETDRFDWTDGLYRLFGLTPQSMRPTLSLFLGLVHQDDRESVRQAIDRAQAQRSPFTLRFRIVRGDGELRDLCAWGRVVYDHDSQFKGLVGICRDETEEKKLQRDAARVVNTLAERARQFEETAAYRAALLSAQQETALDGIVTISPRGTIESFNHRFLSLWGLPQGVLEGGSARSLMEAQAERVRNPERFVERMERLYGQRTELSFDELELRSGRIVDCYSGPVFDRDEFMGRVWFYRDVTEQRRDEEALRHRTDELARSNADLALFAATAAHDLVAPLRKIVVFSEFLQRRASDKLDARESDMLAHIRGSSARLTDLVTDLLFLSRVGHESAPADRVPLGPLLESVADDLGIQLQEARATLTIGPLPVVLGSASALGRLFCNLISNSIKYRDPDRPLRIEVGCRTAPDGSVAVAVQDNGLGFDQLQASRLFEPFRRLHQGSTIEGTGLGLSICARIARMHGGSIAAKGEIGKGATVVVTLPARAIAERPRDRARERG